MISHALIIGISLAPIRARNRWPALGSSVFTGRITRIPSIAPLARSLEVTFQVPDYSFR